MLKIINDTIDESINSEEMKDKSQLLLSDNEIKIRYWKRMRFRNVKGKINLPSYILFI